MKLFLVACLVAAAVAGRLENTYLPPAGAGGAGGSGLGTPFGGSSASRFGGFGSASSSAFKSFSGAPAPAPGHGDSGAYHSSSYSGGPQIGITRYSNDNDGLGHYHYEYETQNHISAQETGQLKSAPEGEAIAAQGSFSYTGPDGQTYTVNYIADENGFQPSGAHLPTPPPIPDAILKSLQFNAANPSSEGSYDSGAGAGGQYQSAPTFSRQYIAPNKPSFSPQSGYRY